MGFWGTVGKITSVIMEESLKKQKDLQRKTNNQLKTYERKLNNAQNSSKMANPEYARKVKEAQEKLEKVKSTTRVHSSNPEQGTASLKAVGNSSNIRNEPGVYILKLHGKIMKVGSAEIGVQKRMQQYYGLNPSCGLNKHINDKNRDKIIVTFQHCPKEKCEELESKLFDKYGDVASMPWAERRPHCNQNTYPLKI